MKNVCVCLDSNIEYLQFSIHTVKINSIFKTAYQVHQCLLNILVMFSKE